MLSITVTAEVSASPKQVLALAGTDFSAHRAKVWPNVAEQRLDVHERGHTYAEAFNHLGGRRGWGWYLARP